LSKKPRTSKAPRTSKPAASRDDAARPRDVADARRRPPRGGENSLAPRRREGDVDSALLPSRLAILDETDSGLDIDALRIVAQGVNTLRSPENATIVVTHYQRLLNYIIPDFVHVLANGRIVKSGGKELALELEEKGYDWLQNAGAGAGAAA